MNKINNLLENSISIKLLKYIFIIYILVINLISNILYIYFTKDKWFSLQGEVRDVIVYYWIYPILIILWIITKIFNNNLTRVIANKFLLYIGLLVVSSLTLFINSWDVFFSIIFNTKIFILVLLIFCLIANIVSFIKSYKKHGKINMMHLLYHHLFYAVLLLIPNMLTVWTFAEANDKSLLSLFLSQYIAISILVLFSASLGMVIVFMPEYQNLDNSSIIHKNTSFFMQLIIYLMIACVLVTFN